MPDGSQALLIDKAGSDDIGEYEVLASNSQGNVSCKAQLEVTCRLRESESESKPQFLSPLTNVSVEEGEPLNLQALFLGNPVPDISWSKDGKAVQASEQLMMSCDGKKVCLEINPSHAKDSGLYACELYNPLGSDKSKANVTVRKVNQSPIFTQKFSDLQQMISCDVKFAARVSGIPQPDIIWSFNDKQITADSDKYKVKRDGEACCLYIKDCSYADCGRYRCRAVNKEGKADCEASLSIVKDL